MFSKAVFCRRSLYHTRRVKFNFLQAFFRSFTGNSLRKREFDVMIVCGIESMDWNEVKSSGREVCERVSCVLSQDPAERKTRSGICKGHLYSGTGYAAAFSLYDQWKV